MPPKTKMIKIYAEINGDIKSAIIDIKTFTWLAVQMHGRKTNGGVVYPILITESIQCFRKKLTKKFIQYHLGWLPK